MSTMTMTRYEKAAIKILKVLNDMEYSAGDMIIVAYFMATLAKGELRQKAVILTNSLMEEFRGN